MNGSPSNPPSRAPANLDTLRGALDGGSRPPVAHPRPAAPTPSRDPAPRPMATLPAGTGARPPAPSPPPTTPAASRVEPLRAPWPILGASLLIAAGVLHLILLPAHLAEARGLGLYFCVIGVAQLAWGILYILRPTEWTRRVGLAALAISPVALFILTRTLRAPWSEGPEELDFIGVATCLLEILAAVGLCLRSASPTLVPRTASKQAVAVASVLVLVGIALGGVSYGAGLAVEGVHWLSESEAEHGAGGEHVHPASESSTETTPSGGAHD